MNRISENIISNLEPEYLMRIHLTTLIQLIYSENKITNIYKIIILASFPYYVFLGYFPLRTDIVTNTFLAYLTFFFNSKELKKEKWKVGIDISRYKWRVLRPEAVHGA